MGNEEKYLNFDSPENVQFFDELPLWSAPFGVRLFEQIHLRKNITAVDIGSGAGFPLTELAIRLGKSCTVYGIDPWEAAIVRAARQDEVFGRIESKLNEQAGLAGQCKLSLPFVIISCEKPEKSSFHG
jgi:SAM-dependent methyltransferase